MKVSPHCRKPHGYSGKLIVIEGPDGCGKGTQIEMLVRALKKEHPDREVVVTHEPWDVPESPDGMRIRRILKHEESEIDPGDGRIDVAKLQKMYVCDRYMHWVCVIIPALKRGAIVICDRERMSTYAYGHAFGLDVSEIDMWHEQLPIPDRFVLLDVPATTCAERMQKRAEKNGEKLEFFEQKGKVERIMPSYRHIRDLGILPAILVDGTGSPKQVSMRIFSEVLPILERM